MGFAGARSGRAVRFYRFPVVRRVCLSAAGPDLGGFGGKVGVPGVEMRKVFVAFADPVRGV